MLLDIFVQHDAILLVYPQFGSSLADMCRQRTFVELEVKLVMGCLLHACMHLHMVGWVFGPCWVPHTYLGSSPRSLMGALHMVGVFSLAGVTNLPNCLLANSNTARLRTARRDQSCAKLSIML